MNTLGKCVRMSEVVWVGLYWDRRLYNVHILNCSAVNERSVFVFKLHVHFDCAFY